MKTDFDKIMMDIYRELYQNSEPVGDFDKLLANAVIDEDGRKHIPYMDYEISQENLDNIINKHLLENKLIGPRVRSVGKKYDAQRIKTSIYLGCSPKTKNDE